MFYNSRKRVYNMGVKSERNLSGSRADDLNQLIIFPPYHIVNPRDASLGDLLFFVFVTALAFLCLSKFFSQSSVLLRLFSAAYRFFCTSQSSVLLQLFSAAYRFFCTDFSFSSQNSVFPADLSFTAFLPFFAMLFLADLIFYAAFSGNPRALVRRHAQKLGKRKNAPPPLAGAHCSHSLLFPLIRHKLL